METLEQTLKNTHDWTLKRVDFLSKKNRHDLEDHDVFSMEYIGEGSQYE